VDLHTLVGQFTALRHEVNLQTRATRNQQEQTAESLSLLKEALEAVEQPADEDQQRPVLKGLVDLYDALALARREMERARETVSQASRTDEPIPDVPPPSFWERVFGRSPELAAWRQRFLDQQEERKRLRSLVESVVTGYTMSLQRLDRLLEQLGLEPMRCAGQPFDPERMEVLEAVADSGRSSGEVVEEVRRGYLWRGRVFRFALVRVAKG
jgi:molecular chaperone GrpE